MERIPFFTHEDVATAVRRLRKDRRLKQSELAAKAGVSIRFISTLENGGQRAELAKVLDVLSALDVVPTLMPTPEKSWSPDGHDLSCVPTMKPSARAHRASWPTDG